MSHEIALKASNNSPLETLSPPSTYKILKCLGKLKVETQIINHNALSCLSYNSKDQQTSLQLRETDQ